MAFILGEFSSVSFKGSKGDNLNSVYKEHFSNKVNSHMTVPPLDTYFNPVNDKQSNEYHHQYGNLICLNRKLNIKEKKIIDHDFTRRLLINNDINCYNQNQSQGSILNESPSPDHTINFEELNKMAFTISQEVTRYNQINIALNSLCIVLNNYCYLQYIWGKSKTHLAGWRSIVHIIYIHEIPGNAKGPFGRMETEKLMN